MKGYRFLGDALEEYEEAVVCYEKFRELIVSDHPALVLYEGDPDRLADSEIRVGLF